MAAAQRILDYLISQQPAMIDLLTELVAMESPSTEASNISKVTGVSQTSPSAKMN